MKIQRQDFYGVVSVICYLASSLTSGLVTPELYQCQIKPNGEIAEKARLGIDTDFQPNPV